MDSIPLGDPRAFSGTGFKPLKYWAEEEVLVFHTSIFRKLLTLIVYLQLQSNPFLKTTIANPKRLELIDKLYIVVYFL
jgi:hypothetical protein